jgi:MoaA/NifB/PqqE/SkfB family radical SAM enzyme
MIATDLVVKHEINTTKSLRARGKYKMNVLKGLEKRWFHLWINYHLFILALKTYGSITRSIKVLGQLNLIRQSTMGPGNLKIIKVNGKYYHHLYAPGFPSKIFDEYIKGEFNRIIPVNQNANLLTFIFFAITKKCPLQCEHCFEWDNLNKKESLELHHLKAVLKKFQKDGLSQFHLSGGEPLARIKDLQELISTADKDAEFYVLTSGFNFTAKNAKALKNAGLTGVVISLDHFDKEKHNAFRGFNDSFTQAIQAIQHAQEQNLVVALTICVTRDFITWQNLLQYADFAKKMNVVFIQLLEPKAVGHYKEKDVFLNKSQLELLERFYEMMNLDASYKDYPIIIYHGYHQRRVGCMSGGNRALYIDSEGWVNACPFCHTKNFNIKEVLENNNDFKVLVRSANCPS